jgi:hypothetical protein
MAANFLKQLHGWVANDIYVWSGSWLPGLKGQKSLSAIYSSIKDQVDLKKSNLLQNIQIQNTKTLQIFKKIIKTWSIYESD